MAPNVIPKRGLGYFDHEVLGEGLEAKKKRILIFGGPTVAEAVHDVTSLAVESAQPLVAVRQWTYGV